MKLIFVPSFAAVVFVLYFSEYCSSLPQQEIGDEENYTGYAYLYPEIAKKIGEEPIEIIDVVKSVRVYDSDDETTPSTAEELTEPPPPDRLEVESVNATTPTNATMANATQSTPNPNLW